MMLDKDSRGFYQPLTRDTLLEFSHNLREGYALVDSATPWPGDPPERGDTIIMFCWEDNDADLVPDEDPPEGWRPSVTMSFIIQEIRTIPLHGLAEEDQAVTDMGYADAAEFEARWRDRHNTCLQCEQIGVCGEKWRWENNPLMVYVRINNDSHLWHGIIRGKPVAVETVIWESRRWVDSEQPKDEEKPS